jgi:Domain of unknown function (DUF4389)
MEGLEGFPPAGAPGPDPIVPEPAGRSRGQAVRYLLAPDDLERNRLTVFFRLLLVIPHFIGLFLYALAVFFTVIVAWFAALFTGKVPDGLHRFMARFVRYSVQVNGYLYLAAESWPMFFADRAYAVDVEIPPAEPQGRWSIFGRIVLAIPAIMLSGALIGGGATGGGGTSSTNGSTHSGSFAISSVGLTAACAFCIWFAAVLTAKAPRGLRDAVAYAVGYSAQVYAYVLLLTSRYPDSDPLKSPASEHVESHAVALENSGDLRRSRVTVFFRLFLALPHFVWLALWAIAALIALIPLSLGTLFTGRPPARIHEFLCRFIAYSTHVNAFFWLTANPFPGFAGAPGSYPIEVQLPPPSVQNRWKTFFRWVLAVPAFIVASGLSGAFALAGFFGWWAALFTGRMPEGLRNLSLWALRYNAQLYAYSVFVTDRYPYAGPVVAFAPPTPEAAPLASPLPTG